MELSDWPNLVTHTACCELKRTGSLIRTVPLWSQRIYLKAMSKMKDIPDSSPDHDGHLDKLTKVIDAYRVSKALFAACDLGIFDKLHTASMPQSAREITQTMSFDLDATTRLLDTLVALEFLEKTKQGDQWIYNNTQMATKFLTSSSPDSQLGFIAFTNKTEYPLFGNLESAVIDGTTQYMKTFGKSPSDVFQEILYSTEEASLRFTRGMHSSSFHGCYAVANAVDLSAFSSCCDLGGGVGTLAYALCQHNPQMKITVCDLQPVVNLAHHFRPSVEACPNQANVCFEVGDFFKADLPKADLYALSRVLHDWPEDKIDLILSNVFKCLPSGGGLLICEQILNENKSGPEHTLLTSLKMLVATGGKERTASEYKQLLEKHGFVDVQAKLVDHSPYMDAILCRKM